MLHTRRPLTVGIAAAAVMVVASAVPRSQVRYDAVQPSHQARASKTTCALDKSLPLLPPAVVASPLGTWIAQTEYYAQPQSGPPPPRVPDAVVIEAAKKTMVQEIEPKLPKVTFEEWLRGLVGLQAPMKWEVNDCGEQTGNPAQDKGRDFPMCAEVNVTLGPKHTLMLSIAMGTFGTGLGPKRVLFMGLLSTPDGKRQWIKTLAEVPALLGIK